MTHAPFRPWCPYCVRGRAHKTAHKELNHEDDETKVPRVSMDYFYMSQEDDDAGRNPLLVMVNEQSGEKFARALGQKGVPADGSLDWAIKDASAELKSWGHA